METKELIQELKNILPEPIDYAEMVGAPGWAYGCMYGYEDPEYYLIEEAVDTLEKLDNEKKQYIIKLESLLKDFKEFMLNLGDVCRYCKHNQPCQGKKCEQYIKGVGVEGLNGYTHDWQRSCEDFNFGACPKLENTPCNGCIKNNMSGFEWRGCNGGNN